MKKVLLTGGNGFIGKNILESFLAQKYEIVAPRSFELDLIDTECVDNFFDDKNFDVVIHCAVKPGHRNAKDSTNLFHSNVKMFLNLERHKDKYNKFINIGSGAVYDNSVDITDADESELFTKVPDNDHGFTKYAISKYIHNLENFVDLNIFGIFGKHEDYSIRFISNAICKTLFDLPITLRQNRRFSYLYIDDLMPVLEFFIENTPKYSSYNVVPDYKAELSSLANIIRDISGKNIEVNIANSGYGPDYTGDNSLLKKEFVNVKFTNIEDSIRTLYNYYCSNLSILDKNLLLEDK